MPLQVVSVTPAPDSQGQALELPIRVLFSAPLDAATVTSASFVVTHQLPVSLSEVQKAASMDASAVIPGTLAVDTVDGKGRITFTPQSPLPPNTLITVVLSSRIRGTDGSALGRIYRWSFTTGSQELQQPPAEPSQPLARPYGLARQVPLTVPGPWLELQEALPPHESSNLPLTTDTITLIFNKPLQVDRYGDPQLPAYTLRAEPVDGNYWRNPAAGDLAHTVEVSGEVMILMLNLAATPLARNNLVVLTIPGTLTAQDGSRLRQALTYTFSTLYEPLYGSARLVRSMVGSFIEDVSDDAINLALYKASVAADYLVPPRVQQLGAEYQQYLEYLRQEYALVTAAMTVAVNSERAMYRRKSKTLGELQVSWEQSDILSDFLKALKEDQQRLRDELQHLGLRPPQIQTVVRSELHPDTPVFGRDFSGNAFSPPIANVDMVPFGSRRRLKLAGQRSWWKPTPWS